MAVCYTHTLALSNSRTETHSRTLIVSHFLHALAPASSRSMVRNKRRECALHETHESNRTRGRTRQMHALDSRNTRKYAQWQCGRMAVAATASGSDSSNTRGRTACSCVCTACHDSFTGHGQLGRRASQRSHYPPKQTRQAELLHSARGATLRAVQKLSPRRYGPRVPRRAHLICVISAARQAPWSTCKRRLCCACAVPVLCQCRRRARTSRDTRTHTHAPPAV